MKWSKKNREFFERYKAVDAMVDNIISLSSETVYQVHYNGGSYPAIRIPRRAMFDLYAGAFGDPFQNSDIQRWMAIKIGKAFNKTIIDQIHPDEDYKWAYWQYEVPTGDDLCPS
jgi:hypothetical protein